jgi:hypothetical protein
VEGGLMEGLGKALLALAAVCALVGVVLLLAARYGLGRLPGDIVIRRGSFRLYAPLGLMVVLSLLMTLVLNLFSRR